MIRRIPMIGRFAARQPGRRRRRGVEAIEFAMILPIYIATIFAIFEFSFYMFQRSSAVDAARRGCRAAAQLDPELDDFALAVSEKVEAVLEDSNLLCDDPDITCTVNVETALGDTPPRVQCSVEVTYRTLTGLFGQSDDPGSFDGVKVGTSRWNEGGFKLLPDNLRGTASAVFEGVAP